MSVTKPRLWAPRRDLIQPRWRHLWDGLIWAVFPGGDWRHEIISGDQGVLVTEANSNWMAATNRGISGECTASISTGGLAWSPPIGQRIDKSFTIMSWRDVDAMFAWMPIWSWPWRADGTWSSPWYHIGLERNGSTDGYWLGFADTGGTSRSVTAPSGTGFAISGEHIWSITRDGTNVAAYLDGTSKDTRTGLGTDSQGYNGNPEICALQRDSVEKGAGVDGRVFAQLLWNRALSPREIAEMDFSLRTWEFLIPMPFMPSMAGVTSAASGSAPAALLGL